MNSSEMLGVEQFMGGAEVEGVLALATCFGLENSSDKTGKPRPPKPKKTPKGTKPKQK